MFLREVIERNRKVIAGIVFAPAILIGIIGLIFGDGVREVPVAVVNKDVGIEVPFMGKTSISQQLLDRVDKNVLKITEVKSENEAMEMIRKGQVYGIIVFPENLTKEMFVKMEDPTYQLSEKILVKLDKSSLVVSGVIMQSLLNSFMEMAKQSSGSSPLPIEIHAAMGVENVVFGDYILSGIISLLAFIISLVGVAFVVMNDKKNISFKSFSSSEIIFTYLLVFTVVIFISMILMYSVSIPLFDMNLNNGVWVAIVGTVIFLLASVSMGIMIGTVAANFEGIRIGVLISVLPIFFGNIILPMEAMPSWLRPIVYIFPPYYEVKIYRGSVLKQLSLGDFWVEIVILSAFFIVFFVASWFLLSKNKINEG